MKYVKYKVLGFVNGIAKLLTIDSRMVIGSEFLEVSPEGPEGGIVKTITPDADRISKAKVVDLSLDGLLDKNKQV